jgi:hypothetical protein
LRRKLNDVNGAKHPGSRRWRNPARRDGAVAVVLFVLPAVIALVLVILHHHLDVATVGVLVGAAVGLPVAWLTWAVFRDTRRSAVPVSELSTVQAADQLAVATGTQWHAEASLRRLNDPWPLPVSWVAADASLTDAWDSVVKQATSDAGSPSPAGIWAAGPDGLAGMGGDLVDVLARVPTGRLVVLGEPGAGKTMLMVQLVLDLLARRAAGGPVPILAPVASWNPEEQDLRSWLAAQLMNDYPALAATPPTGMEGATQAEALLASGLILPILDGLDEIPGQVRGSAISRINDALRPGEPLVVTCRSQQYRNAVRPEHGVEVNLRGAAAVELRPLDADTVRSYLCDDASGPAAKARWGPVLDVLGTEAPAGQALQIPLMVGLARAIYNPRPGELVGKLRHPAELCNPALADRASVESLLFDAFIPAAYRQDSAGRWKAEDAERWLVFLARHLEYTIRRPDLAWWQLPLAMVLAPSTKPTKWIRTTADRISPMASAMVWILNVLLPLVPGLAAGGQIEFRSMTDFVVGVVPRNVYTLRYAWPSDIGSAASPAAGIALGRRAAIIAAIRTGVVAGVVGGVLLGVVVGILLGVVAGIVVAVLAAVVGAVAFGILASLRSAWPQFEIARMHLALKHCLPRPLMDFLADAHRRGVLRQAGTVYQFRHIELQHQLATHRSPSPEDLPHEGPVHRGALQG